jgi:hypothetical protein
MDAVTAMIGVGFAAVFGGVGLAAVRGRPSAQGAASSSSALPDESFESYGARAVPSQNSRWATRNNSKFYIDDPLPGGEANVRVEYPEGRWEAVQRVLDESPPTTTSYEEVQAKLAEVGAQITPWGDGTPQQAYRSQSDGGASAGLLGSVIEYAAPREYLCLSPREQAAVYRAAQLLNDGGVLTDREARRVGRELDNAMMRGTEFDDLRKFKSQPPMLGAMRELVQVRGKLGDGPPPAVHLVKISYLHYLVSDQDAQALANYVGRPLPSEGEQLAVALDNGDFAQLKRTSDDALLSNYKSASPRGWDWEIHVGYPL